MSLNDEVKSKLVEETHLKILAASLESTNDPVSYYIKYYSVIVVTEVVKRELTEISDNIAMHKVENDE